MRPGLANQRPPSTRQHDGRKQSLQQLHFVDRKRLVGNLAMPAQPTSTRDTTSRVRELNDHFDARRLGIDQRAIHTTRDAAQLRCSYRNHRIWRIVPTTTERNAISADSGPEREGMLLAA